MGYGTQMNLQIVATLDYNEDQNFEMCPTDNQINDKLLTSNHLIAKQLTTSTNATKACKQTNQPLKLSFQSFLKKKSHFFPPD